MADFLVFVTVQPSAKPQQMMHRNGKKNAVSRRTTRDFRKNSENTSRNTSLPVPHAQKDGIYG